MIRAYAGSAYFKKSDLSSTILTGTNFQRSDFSDAVLQHADLQMTVLRGATFRRADLRDANLAGAVLKYPRGQVYDGTNLARDADFRDAIRSE
jgi:uncharacterized protein YjbI with pentapeptide repeats